MFLWKIQTSSTCVAYPSRNINLALVSIMSEMVMDHSHSEPEEPEQAFLSKLEENTRGDAQSTTVKQIL